jgi:tetratricopeptide (TPR) repeat protein
MSALAPTTRLVEFLCRIPALSDPANRLMLTNGLPGGPVSTIARSAAPRTDLQGIVQAALSMGRLPAQGRLGIEILLENTVPFVQGTHYERELDDLRRICIESENVTASPASPVVTGVSWHVPYPQNPFFTGRQGVFAALRRLLTKRRCAFGAQAISGMGGIGKTQTAVEYAYRYRDKYKAVLWLNGESTLDLKASCGQLARLMRLPHPQNDLGRAVVALKHWLATEVGWLLVFDNADDPAALKPFLPDAKHGHILVTSRAQDFQDLGMTNPVELEPLNVDDATAFLLHRSNRGDANVEEKDAAERLARELDGLPLALEQAAAYVVERRVTFQRYVEGYHSRGLRLIEERLPALGSYSKSVATTWLMNFDAVQEESSAAADVLLFSAFLAPDAIPLELLTLGAPHLGPRVLQALARSHDDPLLAHDLLRPLGRFSLIRIDAADETYRIHRMVQEVLRAGMDDATRRLWAQRAVLAVNQSFPPVVFANWPLCGRLLPHALAVASLIERHGMEFVEAAVIHNQVALYLHSRGEYAEAEPHCRRALETLRKVLGERHPGYAASLNNLAELFRAMGRHAEAEPPLRQALEIRRSALGEWHPDYATSLNNLAGLYRAMRRDAEAEPLLRQALEICRAALGGWHPDYAGSLNNLARLYETIGRHAEAEQLYLKALEINRTALGERHPGYATSLNNLAMLHHAMGRHAEAEPLLRQALEIRRTALGERHPDYAASLNNLAELYKSTGRHAAAEPLYLSATENCRTSLGQQHPQYATFLNNLADLYRAMHRDAEAEPLLRQALEIRRSALGERHPDYAASLDNLARLYRAMVRHADAWPLRLKALELLGKLPIDQHPGMPS